MQRGYSTYKQTGVMTADPNKLVLLCYEEAIRSLHLATLMYSSGKYEAKGKAVQKALDIINELREALDFDRGGTIATSLDSLYAFMLKHILKSDLAREVKGFGQVANMLEQLKSAWEKVFFGSYEESVSPLSTAETDSTTSTQSLGYMR
jgi:flagellar secretion chaperone FliS